MSVHQVELPPKPTTPCRVYRGAKNGAGYGWLNRHRMLLHRWVWEQINGPIPDGMKVLHACDNPPCFRYDHLFLGTMKDNTADMLAKGRDGHGSVSGPDHPRWLDIDSATVARIRSSPLSAPQLSVELGISQTTIKRIRRGERNP